ncbi:hypothetical protein Tco_0834410 [Tanacetum coccineum]
MIFCTIKSKPLALPWGRTPRLDSGVRTWGLLDYIGPADTPEASGSGSGAGAEVSVSSAEGNVVEWRRPFRLPEAAGEGQEKKLLKRSDPLPAKRLRIDHPSLASGIVEVTRSVLSPPGRLPHMGIPTVYTAADIVTSSRGKTLVVPTSDVGGSSQPETSEESADSFLLRLLKSFGGRRGDEVSRRLLRLRDQDSKDTDISLLDSRASYLKSALDDSQSACDEARHLISSLSSERDGLASEVSTLHSAFHDFKEKMEAQQEAQAQELYNRVAELEAHVMDVSGRLEGEFYPAYLTALAGRRWLLTHGMELAMVKCLKSPEYQGILGHALGRAVDYGMQEGLAAGHEHGIAGTPLSAVVAYNPETAENNYLDAVRALEEADFPLVHLLKSKKDSGMDEVLDCFLLDGPLASLPEAAHLQPCLEQLSVPIYHADVNAVAGETSLSFALLNVHTRAEGAKKHAAALRQLMVDIVSHPLSSQNLLGEASTSAVAPCVGDLDTDEDLGSVVCMPQFEDSRFEILP